MTILARPDRDQQITLAAGRLRAAAYTGKPTPAVRNLLGSTDIALAYDVQRRLTKQRQSEGARIVGRKIGLTSLAVQQQLGVDQPDFGILFDDMQLQDAGNVPTHRLLQPKIEAEVAFVLEHHLGRAVRISELTDPVTHDEWMEAVRAVSYAAAALEIVDSRVENWDISIVDTIADNASSGLFVLGNRQVSLAEFAPVMVGMTLTKNGKAASSGNGAACLGDPLNALAWLARAAATFGDPLQPGDIILSGALGPMVPVAANDVFRAELSTLGSVSVSFS